MNHEQLMTEMLRALEIDRQYIRHFRAEQAAEIAMVRSLGRKAARRLGSREVAIESSALLVASLPPNHSRVAGL